MAKTTQGRGGPPVPNADPKYNWPGKPSVIGTHVKRLDGPEKVTGRAKYTFDINRPGMLYGKIVRSPYPHARVVNVDLTAAQRAPGVKAAIVWKGPGSVAAPGAGAAAANAAVTMFQGDEVAAVCADTEERAIDAARLITVEWEVLPHVTNVDQALAGTAPQVFQPSNIRAAAVAENGDVAAGFKAAAHTIDETYATHVITHVCMETHGTVCEWEGDKLTIYTPTGGIANCRTDMARDLGIPLENVRVICQYMGGNFGNKNQNQDADLITAQLAKMAGAPVKLEYTRKEDFKIGRAHV